MHKLINSFTLAIFDGTCASKTSFGHGPKDNLEEVCVSCPLAGVFVALCLLSLLAACFPFLFELSLLCLVFGVLARRYYR